MSLIEEALLGFILTKKMRHREQSLEQKALHPALFKELKKNS